MGIFNLFKPKPAPKKSFEQALQTINSVADPNLIFQLAMDTDFGEKEAETLGLRAADRLWELQNRFPDAKKVLARLAAEAASPIVRCHAAYFRHNRPQMRKLVENNITDAYTRLDPRSKEKPKDAGAWIGCVEDKDTLIAALEAASKHGSFINEVYPNICGKNVLSTLFWSTKNEYTREALIDYVSGSSDEYGRIASQTDSEVCRSKAIRHMSIHNPVLLELAGQGYQDALSQLFHHGGEEKIVAMADAGNMKAVKYLINTSSQKDKYRKRFESLLADDLRQRAMAANRYGHDSEKLVGEAIRKGVLPEEKLEEIALTWTLSDITSLPWDAMRQIKDPDRLARLLMEREADHRFKSTRDAWNAFGKKLVDTLQNREDVMVRCILETDYDASVKQKALGYIQDPDNLLKIAMEDSYLAPEAAERLPKDLLAQVRNSKNRNAAKMGMAEYNRRRIPEADETELMEIMHWALKNQDNPDLYLKALEQLKTQPTLLNALRAWLDSGRQHSYVRENKPWAGVGGAILERINDGTGLVDVCFEKHGSADPETVARMKQLIHDTEEEKRFTKEARRRLLEIQNDWSLNATLLSLYYNLPDDEHAIWQFGGPEFVTRILSRLQRPNEYATASYLGRVLVELYKNVPESHAKLDPANGKHFSTHVDITSACASESKSYSKDYILELKKE